MGVRKQEIQLTEEATGRVTVYARLKLTYQDMAGK
jgi:hypothetical protein